MRNIIDIQRLTKRYGKLTALDSVTLSIAEGSLFGLIGPDGAGKSTLYQILTTLLTPDEGSVTVAGLDVVKDFRQLRTEIGYMPEKFSLYPDLTVRENLHFFASLFGVRVEDNFDLIAPIFAQLEKFPNRRAGALSGGMKQKLALACALIHRPKVLLLDEPTTGVDAVSRSEFWNMLTTLKEQGITILVSTSYMDEAERCGQIALMNKGRILDMNTPARLIEGMDKNLYNASAADMYPLLKALRALPDVEDCYTFGATLHVVARDNFNPDAAVAKLRRDGLADARIYPARGNIEDLFIKLAKHDEPDNDLEK
ncbi:ABC transporter ATP-binding protein [Bacteroides sp. ET71]|uniref:ABC transporter ATP-binding protein n=1 Tax=Bacteroides sp. ET71 TaxID=2939421 RepID=UPI00201319E8|nr:ABC transporter ATP-binding protein [Bacteroides sp. ET71]MCL1615956.1 ABC transporter ATP-binding protein [Bacteroides sp. ET71]